ncbi:DegT/DnrJ/EryC1/StrS family aminotransferase [Candidatus Nitronereus thalassa]|uniref:DegT/DnrJ/EryC1/StrS family aminotransferase n=1 Tax=Candidatus Nitronereus thalassa TaxID=3020898 RepID=A0ABU3KCP1_9BACT|nr:DegT/DnrJ/EryC1/StrS family aminotransferase [Candidatus Nitronereus thalassa]MDT7044211.1 DegT/DnrJ/EryC1/StrS family aminotransferase [Candidatus Nitronereus thalassa]
MKVPLLDLKAQFKEIRADVLSAIEGVCDDQSFILGERVSTFEKQVATFLGCRYAVGVASGSDALLLSLMTLNLQPGDEVITVPFTFFSTAGVVSRLGATPVFVDIQADTFNLDPEQIEKNITSRTKAIIPVHLFGQCADMGKILEVANRHGVKVIEDACQAIGAEQQGQKAGTMGYTGCFSFFPSKNLGGVGDGGLISTNDETLKDLLLALRVHGSRSDYHHDHIGMNSRLDALEAAVLQVKLPHLNTWNTKRQQNAATYDRLFADAGLLNRITLPHTVPGNVHIFNQYTIRAQNRDQLMSYLQEHGIGHKVYYPVPLHLQECYQPLGYQKGDLPVSERMATEVLSLPVYPELPESQMELVVSTIKDFYANH